MNPAAAIAAATALEAVRSRLAWVLALAACAAAALALFAGQLALTETGQVETALLAATLRPAAAFVVAAFIATGMSREAHDRVQSLLLALPISRAHYVAAKLAGYCAVSLAAALLCALALAPFAPAGRLAAWTASLAFELWIVAAFALLCAAGLRSSVAALAATLAFYLFARAVAALQMLAHLRPPGWQRGALDAIAAIVPHLDRYARSDWLLYPAGGAAALPALALQAAIALALLGGAAALDLERRDIE